MGGRGASSGVGSGGVGAAFGSGILFSGGGGGVVPPSGNQPAMPPQNTQNQQNPQNPQNQKKNNKNASTGSLNVDYSSGYDNNGNAQLVKWQGQTDDKSAAFLSKVHNGVEMKGYDPYTSSYSTVQDNLNGQSFNDGYGYYEGDYQRFSLALGLNAKPQIVSEKQFDQMVKQNNLQVVYRGEAGSNQCDRFMNADTSHTGVGSYGDGFYFSENARDANGYASMKGGSAGRVMKMALSPNAKAITHTELRQKMAQAGIKLQSNLRRQGTSAPSASYHNSGEAQFALKLGYNVITDCGYYGSGYHYALTRDAFIVCNKTKHHW